MPASHDLFLSYRWADNTAVEPLLAALSDRGVRVWHDACEVEDLASIQLAVASGLSNARALLAWYSVRYNESRACQWELTSAYTAALAEGDPRKRILVVNPETGNSHVHLPELFDQLHLSGVGVPSDAAAVHALADRIQAALSRVSTTAIGTLRSLTPPVWLPAMGTGSNRFVGRLREMWRLHGALQAGQAAMLTGTGGKAGLALVRGVGGIGKSLMVEEYALRFGATYPGGVFWLRAFGHPDGGREMDDAERINSRDAQMRDIADRLGIDTANLNAAQLRGALTHQFKRRARPFLWIVDDLPAAPGPDDLSGWQAPHPLGATLFTTRSRRLSHVSVIELRQLDSDDARRLLTRQRPLSPADSATADDICSLLGYHALAIDVTAALVNRRGLAAVLEALQKPDRDALALAAELDEALPNGHQRYIAATFLASIQHLDEPPHELLRYAAVLSVAPIPRQLLVSCAEAARLAKERDEASIADARDEVDLATSKLLSTCLADDAGDSAISVHALVSRTVRFADSSVDAWAAVRARMVDALSAAMVQAGDVRRHRDLASWVTHARYVSKSPEDTGTTTLLGWVALYDLERGSYALATLGFNRVLEVRRRLLGEEHPDTLVSMGRLADTLNAQGDLPGARQLEEAVLAARKRLLGEEHPDTLVSMGHLANTLRAQGDLSGARQLHTAVLAASRRLLGEEHRDTLVSMGNLANTLFAQGDLPGARRLEEAVLAARKRLLGEEHPDTLVSMSNLASSLRAHGDLPGARQLNEAVLEARKRLLGEEHPDTLVSMGNLANTLSAQGDLPGARQTYEVVVEARKRLMGEEHPDTLVSMGNLAQTLSAQGDLPGARQLQEVVLEASKRLLGKEHPHTLVSMNNLAQTLSAQGDLPGARQLQEVVFEASKRLLGEEHPDTLHTMGCLALTLWRQGHAESARHLQAKVVAGWARTLGVSHSRTTGAQRALEHMHGPTPPSA